MKKRAVRRPNVRQIQLTSDQLADYIAALMPPVPVQAATQKKETR